MRMILLAVLLATEPLNYALGWGAEGHSIVGEIAQRNLSDAARQMVDKLLKHGSLGSVASWADDVKFSTRPETKDWHFVNIPLKRPKYDAAIDCPNGKCVIGALEKLKNDLRCGKDDTVKADAIRFATHLIGDLHQPLHTVKEGGGFNSFMVGIGFCGLKGDDHCTPPTGKVKFHEVWDSTLINATVWAWGSYIDRLEGAWPKTVDVAALLSDNTGPVQWAEESHAQAKIVRDAVPSDEVLDQDYYKTALDVLDEQLARGGVRLARFLNAAYSSNLCPVQ